MGEKLRTNCKITCEMKTIIDFIEYEEVMSELKHNDKIKLVLNLSFNKLGFIDGSRILADWSHAKEQ